MDTGRHDFRIRHSLSLCYKEHLKMVMFVALHTNSMLYPINLNHGIYRQNVKRTSASSRLLLWFNSRALYDSSVISYGL
jgi:hypothetical protein